VFLGNPPKGIGWGIYPKGHLKISKINLPKCLEL